MLFVFQHLRKLVERRGRYAVPLHRDPHDAVVEFDIECRYPVRFHRGGVKLPGDHDFVYSRGKRRVVRYAVNFGHRFRDNPSSRPHECFVKIQLLAGVTVESYRAILHDMRLFGVIAGLVPQRQPGGLNIVKHDSHAFDSGSITSPGISRTFSERTAKLMFFVLKSRYRIGALPSTTAFASVMRSLSSTLNL